MKQFFGGGTNLVPNNTKEYGRKKARFRSLLLRTSPDPLPPASPVDNYHHHYHHHHRVTVVIPPIVAQDIGAQMIMPIGWPPPSHSYSSPCHHHHHHQV